MSTTERRTESNGGSDDREMARTETNVRTAGAWLAIGSLLFVVGLVLHPPPSPDLGEFMGTIADEPTRWMAAHWMSAIALSTFAIAGLLVLTAGSRLTHQGLTTTAWAVLIVAALWVTTTAVAEATVITTAAIAGDTTTFEAWQRFAEGHAVAFVVLAAAVAVIAGNEARTGHETTPAWVSWIGALSGITAAIGFALGVGVGIALGGLVWLVATIVLGLWTFWFGVALTRSDGAVSTRSDESALDGRGTVR